MEHSAAILLRKVPWSETSLIVTWLTENFGKIKTVVRGARRPKSPFAGALDLFYQNEIAFSLRRQSDLYELREATIIIPFDSIRASYVNFFLCSYFSELVDRTAPISHPVPEIYHLMARALRHLQNVPASTRALLHFERELCRATGIHDNSGDLAAIDALGSLIGSIPTSRQTVWDMIGQSPSMRGISHPILHEYNS